MKTITGKFSEGTTDYHLGESLSRLFKYADPSRTVIIADDRFMQYHGHLLENWKKILIPSGEAQKSLTGLETVIDELIRLQADRSTLILGVGGGVITDLAGFAAAVYLRGVSFAFVPTTLLAQVDASIGGKNGINYSSYKNVLGTIRQPKFILIDFDLLRTLPQSEWGNGYAEIIKYACILDPDLFDLLEAHALTPEDKSIVPVLVERSVLHKSEIVGEDEFETGKRRWLNFGHTVGHAVEKGKGIPHGQAVAIGMVAAARLSERLTGFPESSTGRLIRLLEHYELPVKLDFDKKALFHYFNMDKKREGSMIHLVLLNRIGSAQTMPLPLGQLEELLISL
ncbi:MAG TPA: 3-dehydroquinate synthase [Chitinophagaceae bacterium]|nr:3-dehydroquinate synthase [Chitinophagaceae bacterium]